MNYVIYGNKKPSAGKWYWAIQPGPTTNNAFTRDKAGAHQYPLGAAQAVMERLQQDERWRQYTVFGVEPVDTDRDIILADFQAGNDHTSEDLAAVLRFAKAVNADFNVIEFLRAQLDETSTYGLRFYEEREKHGWDLIALSKAAAVLNRRRMRALQALVREGLVKAWWRGGGEGSVNNFGARRFRCYGLKEQTP